MRPSLIRKESTPSPCPSDWICPPVMTKLSTPAPWLTAPTTVPALIWNRFCPLP
ncbi:hypothetical protein D9M71_484620 [compost metagenome]